MAFVLDALEGGDEEVDPEQVTARLEPMFSGGGGGLRVLGRF